MMQVTVNLPSGHGVSLSLPLSSKVGDLKALAQASFEQGNLILVTAEGRVLTDPTESLELAGLHDGDQLTTIVGRAKVSANYRSFAVFCPGHDRVVTWGGGGDKSADQRRLRSLQQVQASGFAFAAICQLQSHQSILTFEARPRVRAGRRCIIVVA